MLELFKLAIQKPVNAVIASLCIVVTVQYTELLDVRIAVAEIRVEQETDKNGNDLVFKMNETLIRVDENVGIIKENLKDLK